MVDAVVRQWMRKFEEKGINAEDIFQIVAYFYADGSLITARDPKILQKAINTLVKLFERVGLKPTQPRRRPWRLCLTASAPPSLRRPIRRACWISIGRKGRGARLSSMFAKKSWQYARVAKEALGFTARRLSVLFGPRRGPGRTWKRAALGTPFLPSGGRLHVSRTQCPQGQAGAGCKTSFSMRYHFAYRHPVDTMMVSGVCYPECPSCGLQVGTARTPKHLASKMCRDLAA